MEGDEEVTWGISAEELVGKLLEGRSGVDVTVRVESGDVHPGVGPSPSVSEENCLPNCRWGRSGEST